MRAVAVIVAFAVAMAAATPAITVNSLNGRADCNCNENSCQGPPCCANGSC
ncbi:hypothetical protein PG995_012229 [Apiospora arundinis]|uniref:Uncharacterized protein n=1 Tax=Apiospora arundinis TaxID=335852 RepID=A0ABR2HK38_9PEZI